MRKGLLGVLTVSQIVFAADFSAELKSRALKYFIDHTHPTTGLVRDRARNFGTTPDRGDYLMSSIAATGFGMAVQAHACLEKKMDCRAAEESIQRGLTFVSQKLENFHGWYYHFINRNNGKRYEGSEISTIDTAFFIAGALVAAKVFPDSRIAALADALYRRLDFTAMRTNGGKALDKQTVSMGWTPEIGYLTAEWDSYAEQTLLILLGMGHPKAPLSPKAWAAFKRPKMNLPDGTTIIGPTLPLFAHQYSYLFVDPGRIKEAGVDYSLNTKIATRRDIALCKGTKQIVTYQKGFWGLSASDSPDGYFAFSPEINNGTVCPACAGASVMVMPEVLSDLEKWASGEYAARIWGQYGFVDSLNLDRNWVNDDVIGITVGALYLALANLDDKNAPRKLMLEYPFFRQALTLTERNDTP